MSSKWTVSVSPSNTCNLFHSQSHHRTQKPTASFQRQEQILFGRVSEDDKMSPEKQKN